VGNTAEPANIFDFATIHGIVPAGRRGNEMAKKELAGRRPADLNRSPAARYIQLATLFRNRIASGEWPVGSRIPNVDQLAEAFSVARGTMREALGLLERDGLVERLRAKGTFVRKSPIEPRTHNLALDWRSLSSAHDHAVIEMLEHRLVKDLPDYVRSEGASGPKYQMMRRLYIRDARPYLLARIFIDELLYRRDATRFRKLPALPILRVIAADRLFRAWQTLTIGVADVELAELLQMPLNAPIARVERMAVDHDGVILYSAQGIYRGDAVRMEADMR
jgi:GntR family transcriptional regulator